MKTIISTDRTPTRAADVIDMGKKDRQQRTVGLKIYEFECDMIPAPTSVSGRRGFYEIAPGYYYAAQAFRTRDGKACGPYQPIKFFTSPEEREKFLTQKIKDFWKSREAQK